MQNVLRDQNLHEYGRCEKYLESIPTCNAIWLLASPFYYRKWSKVPKNYRILDMIN